MASHHTIELDIEGMTCTSCANRIQKKLNKIDGVEANVNFAMEQATVSAPREVSEQQLIQTVEATGYKAHVPQHEEHQHGTFSLTELKKCFMLSVVLAVPIIVISMAPALQFPYWQWVMLTLATPVVFYCGWEFHEATFKQLKHRAVSMDTLISLGTISAYLWSLYALLFGHAGMVGMKHEFHFSLQPSDGTSNIYFEAAAGVTMFLLAGRYFEMKTKRDAKEALHSLMDLAAKKVTVLRGEKQEEIDVKELHVGDLFIVRPGEKIATDGIVQQGISTVDTSMLTGESMPQEVVTGQSVTGATLNVTGNLVIKATQVGEGTKLASIARMVQEAQSAKANIQKLADKISEYFVPFVLVLAVLTFLAWQFFNSSTAMAFTAAVAVLIIACPCALGLATPIALMMGTARGAQLGILIKGPEVLESTSTIDTIVLDKTGTITTGKMSVVQVQAFENVSEAEVLAIAAALESGSEHPIARAIVQGSTEKLDVQDFKNTAGFGVQGLVAGRNVKVGTEKFIEAPLNAQAQATKAALEAEGKTVVLVAWDAKVQGMIAVADTLKDSSAAAVADFKKMGLETTLLTGDNEGAAHFVAQQVGIDHVIAQVLPEDKFKVIQDLQSHGKKVAMVGDGINDAAALAQADLGIAIGTGTDAAIAASDVTIVNGQLTKVVDALRLSRKSFRVIKSNIFWAFAYNILALPLAAFGLLNPMIAGAAMAFSSVAVVLNSLRLRYFRA